MFWIHLCCSKKDNLSTSNGASRKRFLSSLSSRTFCVSMTQQMQNLQLSHSKKGAAPASPSAAKRLYRNLSEKFKGSHSSFEDAYFFGRSDRIRKASVSEKNKFLVTWMFSKLFFYFFQMQFSISTCKFMCAYFIKSLKATQFAYWLLALEIHSEL